MAIAARKTQRMAARRFQAKAPKDLVLKPVFPNAGLEHRYRRALLKLIDQMHKSVQFWLSAAYRADPPLMAQDARPVDPVAKVTPAQLRMLLDVEGGQNPTASGGNAVARRNLEQQGLVRLKPVPPGYQGVREFEVTEAGRKVLEARAAAERTTLRGLRAISDPFISAAAPGEDLPSVELQRAVAKLTARWQRQFDQAAPRLADYFSTAIEERSATTLQNILRDGGFTVQFQMTAPMQDILNATMSANVGLIKSIPQQYLGQVEGMVMRSVQSGGDLGTLTKDLEREYGITRRRAALIARDQNNKATGAMTKARYDELGITEAIWQHSGGGRDKRPTHVANSGKRYDVAKGWFDPAEQKWIYPGQLINCKCVPRAVIPGFG